MTFLILNHGWTPERLLAAPSASDRDHVGVHAQKQKGLYYAGLSLLAGRVSPDSATGLPLAGSAFQRGMVSCTGSEFCKLAIAETKAFSIRLAGNTGSPAWDCRE
jgi:sulfite reductase (ferredoxin)